MRHYLIIHRGFAVVVNATDRRAARTYGLELLGYTPGMQAPRITVVSV